MNDKDIKKIRRKLEDEALAAYFGAGVDLAILDYDKLRRMSDDELKRHIDNGDFKGFI